MPDTPLLRIDRREPALVAVVEQENLDHTATELLRAELKPILADQRIDLVVLQMNQVAFMPSLTMGALVETVTHLKEQNRRLVLAGLSDKIRKTLEITGILQLFETTDTVEQALA